MNALKPQKDPDYLTEQEVKQIRIRIKSLGLTLSEYIRILVHNDVVTTKNNNKNKHDT
jgi:Mobilization protein NikA